MSNKIIRPLAHNLGFDEHDQLWVTWTEDGYEKRTIVADVRGEKCVLCGREWALTAEDYRTQQYMSETQEFVHVRCFQGHLALREYALFADALITARKEAPIGFHMRKIPCGYHGSYETPWYQVQFKDYKPEIKVGTRRRVYEIRMRDLRPEQMEQLKVLTENEDVTKGKEGQSEFYIHAWSRENLTKYFEFFYQVLQMDQPRLKDKDGAVTLNLPAPQVKVGA